MAFVHTLGGRTLDNAYFWPDRSLFIERILQSELKQLQSDHKVVSHAFTHFTTQSILQGDIIGVGNIVGNEHHERRMGKYMRYKNIASDAPFLRIEPLASLKRAVLENSSKAHFVVFSALDEDILLQHTTKGNKVDRISSLRLLYDISAIQRRHLEILRQLMELKGQGVKPILMTQFRWDPHHSFEIYPMIKIIGLIGLALQAVSAASLAFSVIALVTRKRDLVTAALWAFAASTYYGSTFMLNFRATKGILKGQSIKIATLGYLFERIYSPILAQAKKEGIPILDLTNSLNPCGDPSSSLSYSENNPCNNRYIFMDHLYYFGAQLIAEGICHIIKNHDFSQPVSFIYSKEPETKGCRVNDSRSFQAHPNPGAHGWTVQFPKI